MTETHKIVDIKEAIEAGDDCVAACMRTEDLPIARVPDSTRDKCENCSAEIWVGPLTQFVKRRWCMKCVVDAVEKDMENENIGDRE